MLYLHIMFSISQYTLNHFWGGQVRESLFASVLIWGTIAYVRPFSFFKTTRTMKARNICTVTMFNFADCS